MCKLIYIKKPCLLYRYCAVFKAPWCYKDGRCNTEWLRSHSRRVWSRKSYSPAETVKASSLSSAATTTMTTLRKGHLRTWLAIESLWIKMALDWTELTHFFHTYCNRYIVNWCRERYISLLKCSLFTYIKLQFLSKYTLYFLKRANFIKSFKSYSVENVSTLWFLILQKEKKPLKVSCIFLNIISLH